MSANDRRQDADSFRRAYAESLKPHLAHLLEAFGLDVHYHRALGDHLYYEGPLGSVEVVDFIGGFGASLFGHNHPELVEAAGQVLADQRPFHVQASIRGHAAVLAERLSSAIGRTTGRGYIATLCSSGTEAVEAAIKHAELEAFTRNGALLARLAETGQRLRLRIRSGMVSNGRDLFEEASQRLGERIDSLDDLLATLDRKLALLLSRAPTFLAVSGSFHGKSTGALKLTHRLEFRRPWRRLGDATVFVPINDVAAVAAELERMRESYYTLAVSSDGTPELQEHEFINLAAVFVEPIQGEGGIHELSPEFAHALRHAADQARCPLVIDEIQSGLGRTGEFLASSRLGVTGDYYLFSKALGGGLAKVSALLVDRDRYVPEFGYLHTSTFADDDFSSIIALRALDLLERNEGRLLAQCRDKGAQLLARLEQVRHRFPNQVRAVRGRGLMIGVEIMPQTGSSSPLLQVLSDQNLLGYLACGYLLREHRIRVAPTLSKSAVLRVEPSAYISDDAIERLGGALESLCALLQRNEVGQLVSYLSDRRAVPEAEPASPAPATRPRPREIPNDAARVGFLVHFSEPCDLRAWEPGLSAFTDADCARFLDRTRGTLQPFILDDAEMRSSQGAKAHVTFIGVPFTAEQAVVSMRAGDDWALDLVKQGVALARDRGCTVVGLGGHTSIVTDNCREIVEPELTLTSGNSLTVAAAWEGCRLAAKHIGLDLQSSTLGVVGAAGNVGAILAEIAADEVGQIELIGRPGSERFLLPVAQAIYARAFSRLKRGQLGGIAGRIAGTATVARLSLDQVTEPGALGEALCEGLKSELGDAVPLRFAASLDVLRECHVIAACSSAPSPIVLPQHVRRGPVVVCDVAVPQDVDAAVAIERPEAVVIRGGRVWAPLGQTLDIPAMRMTNSELYGCLAETILLGFAGSECPSSYGKLSPFRVRRIRTLAAAHGFGVEERSLWPSAAL